MIDTGFKASEVYLLRGRWLEGDEGRRRRVVPR